MLSPMLHNDTSFMSPGEAPLSNRNASGYMGYISLFDSCLLSR